MTWPSYNCLSRGRARSSDSLVSTAAHICLSPPTRGKIPPMPHPHERRPLPPQPRLPCRLPSTLLNTITSVCVATPPVVGHPTRHHTSRVTLYKKMSQRAKAISIHPKSLSRSYSRSQPATARSSLISASLASELQDIRQSYTEHFETRSGCQGKEGNATQ